MERKKQETQIVCRYKQNREERVVIGDKEVTESCPHFSADIRTRRACRETTCAACAKERKKHVNQWKERFIQVRTREDMIARLTPSTTSAVPWDDTLR